MDELEVTIFEPSPRFQMYGRPVLGQELALHLTGLPGQGYVVYTNTATDRISLPNLVGDILLSPVGLTRLIGGTIPAGGLERFVAPLPNEPALVGVTYYVQAATIGGGIQMSNLAEVTFE